MKNCNWLITDHNNKARDLVAYYKATLPRLSDERIDAISSVRLQSSEEVLAAWKQIPQEYQGVHNKNLGCA